MKHTVQSLHAEEVKKEATEQHSLTTSLGNQQWQNGCAPPLLLTSSDVINSSNLNAPIVFCCFPSPEAPGMHPITEK